ncbi:hypothetical protein SLS62_008577 [Diatrype stigma]|uniref:Uncharacterized protein n=1 Tax=Diatrype stigma TaxID=117547 RepID=A0AAN9UI95_9PEZI
MFGLSEFNSLCSHEILRLTLPSGRQFALDPSAAQYGWHENLAPWEQYHQHRVDAISRIEMLEPFEGFRRFFVNQGQPPNKRHRVGEPISKYVRRVSAELLAESLSTAPSCEGTDGLALLFKEHSPGGWQTDVENLIQQVKTAFTSKARDLAEHLLQIEAVKERSQRGTAARTPAADEITTQELVILVRECDLSYENEVDDSQTHRSNS